MGDGWTVGAPDGKCHRLVELVRKARDRARAEPHRGELRLFAIGRHCAVSHIVGISQQILAVAEHKRLAFGTRLRVTNPSTGASAIVIINDRGPFTRGRDIDLSRGAARAIGLRDVGRICTEVL